ncbi:MAG: UPF0058 family protein [Candidatus Thermoplasmatota archaeon]|nr:UPF0058 family protein [Candidatus Thermoplasmatota archaeon]MBU1940408.1 UPF0058 family protein [Candidatus Thermoplasmatota archaeon]
MQKDELIQLHTFLYQMRTVIEQICNNNGCNCHHYEKLEITPYQIHKSKREHTLAVFTLSKDIAEVLSENHNDSGLDKIMGRLDQMAHRFMTEKEKELIRLQP